MLLSNLVAVSLISRIPLSRDVSGFLAYFLGESASGSPHQEG
jgi:hypothetical protein